MKPREVAEIFGVRTTTVARWARSGMLPFIVTPGGHRRYRWAAVAALLDRFKENDPGQGQLEEDLVRLYEQGWSVRQVAEKFGYSYGVTRRILMRHTVLRSKGGRGVSGHAQRP